MPVTATSSLPTILADLPTWTLNVQTRVNESYLETSILFPSNPEVTPRLERVENRWLILPVRLQFKYRSVTEWTAGFTGDVNTKLKCDLKDQGENDKTRSSGVYVPCWSSRSHVNYHRECRAGKAPGPVSRGLLMRSAVQVPLYPLYPIWGSNKMLSDWRTRQIEPACSIALIQSQWKALLLVNSVFNWRTQLSTCMFYVLFVYLYINH